ncbi:MAG TPA: alpha/beta fold hydrolase [Symbiobacteriaceae bacterium]
MSWLKIVLAIGLSPPLVILGISLAATLVSPIPRDPWQNAPVPESGEYIKVSDGAELFVRHWVPLGDVKQVVLGLHGIGQHSGYHSRVGESLRDAGIAYYAADLRGNGLTRTPHGDVPSQSRIYADVTELVGQLKQRYSGARMYVLGHSLGGALAASWAAETHPDIAGLIAVAPAMTALAAPVPWTNWIRGPAAWLFLRHRPVLLPGPTAYDRKRLSQTVDLPDQVDFIADDPLHLQAMSMAFGLAANDVRQKTIGRAPQIRVPTLVLVGDQDPAQVGAKQMYEVLAVTDKRWVLLPGLPHLLFHIQETPAVMSAITDWLGQH